VARRHEAFRGRRLEFTRYAYLFVDGVHVSVRLGEDDRLCLLVVIGVREDGAKELLAVEDGYRESTGRDSEGAARGPDANRRLRRCSLGVHCRTALRYAAAHTSTKATDDTRRADDLGEADVRGNRPVHGGHLLPLHAVAASFVTVFLGGRGRAGLGRRRRLPAVELRLRRVPRSA